MNLPSPQPEQPEQTVDSDTTQIPGITQPLAIFLPLGTIVNIPQLPSSP